MALFHNGPPVFVIRWKLSPLTVALSVIISKFPSYHSAILSFPLITRRVYYFASHFASPLWCTWLWHSHPLHQWALKCFSTLPTLCCIKVELQGSTWSLTSPLLPLTTSYIFYSFWAQWHCSHSCSDLSLGLLSLRYTSLFLWPSAYLLSVSTLRFFSFFPLPLRRVSPSVVIFSFLSTPLQIHLRKSEVLLLTPRSLQKNHIFFSNFRLLNLISFAILHHGPNFRNQNWNVAGWQLP